MLNVVAVTWFAHRVMSWDKLRLSVRYRSKRVHARCCEDSIANVFSVPEFTTDSAHGSLSAVSTQKLQCVAEIYSGHRMRRVAGIENLWVRITVGHFSI